MGLNDEAINAKRSAEQETVRIKKQEAEDLKKTVANFQRRFFEDLKANAPAAKGITDFNIGNFESRTVIEQIWDATLNRSGIYGSIEWFNDGHKFIAWASGNIEGQSGPFTGVSIEIAGDPRDKKAPTRYRANTLEEIGEALQEEQRRLESK